MSMQEKLSEAIQKLDGAIYVMMYDSHFHSIDYRVKSHSILVSISSKLNCLRKAVIWDEDYSKLLTEAYNDLSKFLELWTVTLRTARQSMLHVPVRCEKVNVIFDNMISSLETVRELTEKDLDLTFIRELQKLIIHYNFERCNYYVA